MLLKRCTVAALALATACSFERTPSVKRRDAEVRPRSSAARDRDCLELDEKGRCDRYAVSLVALIARPDDYDGKPVLVEGFVDLRFEGNAMFLSRDDWRHLITRNAIWIDPPDSLLRAGNWTPRFMLVEGTFDAGNQGHLNLFSGAITNVTRIETSKGSPFPPPALQPER